MNKERWECPFHHSIAYYVFRKHFTELNKIYWSYVPAASTIEKEAKTVIGNKMPKDFFLIHDDDERRLAPTFDEWKKDYREFGNYTRLSMIMLLSSCFETYFRTIVSLAFESKPGIIIQCKDAVDGAFLLRDKQGYGDISNSNYQFSEHINNICVGDWDKRVKYYTEYFGFSPFEKKDMLLLDELRENRNLVGHYFGRTKKKYNAPLIFNFEESKRISHKKIIDYFNLIYKVTNLIDAHLYKDYIGSYDVLKCYYDCIYAGLIKGESNSSRSVQFKKILGDNNLIVPKPYITNLIAYYTIKDTNDECFYNTNNCIYMVRKELQNNDIKIQFKDQVIPFSRKQLNYLCKKYSLRDNKQYCTKRTYRKTVEYYYSLNFINKIVEIIKDNSDHNLYDI